MSKLPIVDHWYETKPISDSITLIYEPHTHPYLRCNIWHIKGRDKDLLIDTGLGVSPLRQEVEKLSDNPICAVATHIHYDHVGCLHEFDERLLHRLEAPKMDNYKEYSDLHMSGIFPDYRTNGDTDGYGDYLIKALPNAQFEVENYRITSTRVTRDIEEGDVLDLGNRHFEVFHLPGHSPGSIGLWEKASGTFFSGDALYDGTLLDELPDSNIADYTATMRRIRELPVSVVHGGHEPSFGRERMLTLIDAYLDWRAS